MLKTTNNTVYVVISLFYQRFCGFHRAAERSLKKKSDSQNLFKKENIFFSQTCMHILVSFLRSPARDGSFSSPPARYIRSTVFHTLVFRNSLLLFSACVALCAFFFEHKSPLSAVLVPNAVFLANLLRFSMLCADLSLPILL